MKIVRFDLTANSKLFIYVGLGAFLLCSLGWATPGPKLTVTQESYDEILDQAISLEKPALSRGNYRHLVNGRPTEMTVLQRVGPRGTVAWYESSTNQIVLNRSFALANDFAAMALRYGLNQAAFNQFLTMRARIAIHHELVHAKSFYDGVLQIKKQNALIFFKTKFISPLSLFSDPRASDHWIQSFQHWSSYIDLTKRYNTIVEDLSHNPSLYSTLQADEAEAYNLSCKLKFRESTSALKSGERGLSRLYKILAVTDCLYYQVIKNISFTVMHAILADSSLNGAPDPLNPFSIGGKYSDFADCYDYFVTIPKIYETPITFASVQHSYDLSFSQYDPIGAAQKARAQVARVFRRMTIDGQDSVQLNWTEKKTFLKYRDQELSIMY